MNLICLDFETYFCSKTFSLKGMTTQEYIVSPQFQTIMVGVHVLAAEHEALAPHVGKTTWYPARSLEFQTLMHTLREAQSTLGVIAHNAMFDGAILDWVYGVRPMALYCTLSMARSLGLGVSVGGSLSALTNLMIAAGVDVRPKGTGTVEADGKRLEDFSLSELLAYGEYCAHDVRITTELFYALSRVIPSTELAWQSCVLQAYTMRPLRLNPQVVRAELERVVAKRAAVMERLMVQLGVYNEAMLSTVLGSNPQFADLLQMHGVEPPTKISKNTGEVAFAFAQDDEGMLELLEHHNPDVQMLVEARMGLKGSLELSRCERFAAHAALGPFPAPYSVSGAHTHRLGGTEKNNLQNLPSGRKAGQTKALRTAIEAPEGYVFVGADSAQIEVRVSDYIIGDEAALQRHKAGVCPYSTMAKNLWPTDLSVNEVKALAKREDEVWAPRRQIAKSLVLGATFQLAGDSFKKYAKTNAGIELTSDEAHGYIKGFRKESPLVVHTWGRNQEVLDAMISGRRVTFGGPLNNLFTADPMRTVLGQALPGIMLPDGMWITYSGLRKQADDKFRQGGFSYVYDGREEFKKTTNFIYGGKMHENLCQAMAFAIMKWYAPGLPYPLALNSHDEHVMVVPDNERDIVKARDALSALMSTSPPWAPNLPMACEVKVGRNYGLLK